MSRITIREAETLSENSQKGYQWFQLKNDHDVKRVRLLINSIDDIDAFVVHSVEINGRNRWINCTRNNEAEPLDNCIYCKNGDKARVRVFLQLQDVETGELLIWDRSPQIIQILRGVVKRINGPIYQTVIEVERVGKAGDPRTTYQFYPVDRNERLRLEDLIKPLNIEKDVFYHSGLTQENKYDENSYEPRNDLQPTDKMDTRNTVYENSSNVDEIGNNEVPVRGTRRVF